MRSRITSRTGSATSGNDQGFVPSDQALSMASGEKHTDCMRRSHSSPVREERTSGVHSTPMKPLLASAVMNSWWL